MSAAAGKRFYVRYAMQRWQRSRWYLGSFIVLVSGLILFSGIRGENVTLLVVLLMLYLIFLGASYLLWRISYLELAPQTLRIRYQLTRIELPYAAVTRVRKQPLMVAFQPPERRRYVNQFVRRLAREPAVYIRIDRRHGDLLTMLERRLGPRLVMGADIILPITEAEDFVNTIKQRLRGTP